MTSKVLGAPDVPDGPAAGALPGDAALVADVADVVGNVAAVHPGRRVHLAVEEDAAAPGAAHSASRVAARRDAQAGAERVEVGKALVARGRVVDPGAPAAVVLFSSCDSC